MLYDTHITNINDYLKVKVISIKSETQTNEICFEMCSSITMN